MRAAAAEGIDAHVAKGGTIVAGAEPAAVARAKAEVDDTRAWGRGEDELRLLDAAEATDVLAATRVRGATYTPDCAAIHPAGWCAASPTPSYAGGSRSTSRRPPRRSRPGA